MNNHKMVDGKKIALTATEEQDLIGGATQHALAQKAVPLKELRDERNVQLAASDWTGLADSALTNEKAAEWKLYRQKLRDLPSGLTTEAKVKAAKWPTKP